MRASHGANVHLTVTFSLVFDNFPAKQHSTFRNAHYMLSICFAFGLICRRHSPLAAPRMVLASTFSAWHGTWNRQESFRIDLERLCQHGVFLGSCPRIWSLLVFPANVLGSFLSWIIRSQFRLRKWSTWDAAQSAWNSANVLLKGLMSFFSLRSLSQRATNAVSWPFVFSWALSQISLEKETWSIVKHHISRFAHVVNVVKQRYLDEFWKANVWVAVWVAHDSVYPASATQVPCSCPLGLSSIKMALRMVALQHWSRTHHSAAVAIEQLILFKIASDAEGHSFSPQLHPGCLGATAMGRICGIIRYQALVKEWGEGLKVVEVKADFLVCRCSVVVDIPETLWHK